MTARSGAWLKANFLTRDPYDYNVDLVDSLAGWTDEFTVGADGDGDDVIFYGDTAGSQLHWDADTDTLELDGTAAKFRLGDFSGATAGDGSVLSAANSAAFRVYCDDGGAAIGSGTLARAGVFRNLLTYTSGNREQEAAGVIGQVVSVAGTNRHNMAGTWGSYEARTSLTVDGHAASTDTWAQAAIIARVGVGSGITTINSNGVLAGVAAMSNTASFAANNGVYAAYYAGAWSGAADWAYGVYLEGGKFTTGIAIGECTTGLTVTSASGYAVDIQTSGQFRMGIQGTGIPTATATPFAMEIHSETASALTAGTTGLSCGIRSRYEISVAQPNQISLTAVEGRLRVKANIADGCHSAVSGTIEGDASLTYSGTATTQRNAGNFSVELGATSTLSAGWITGVTIDSSSNGSLNTASVTYAGLRIKKATSALAWEYGIYMDTSAAAAGICINTVSGTGIDFPAGETYGKALAFGTFGTPIVYSADEPFEIHGRLGSATAQFPLMRVRNSAPASTNMTTGAVTAIQAQAYGTDTSDVGALEALQAHVGIKAACEIIADTGTMPNMRAGFFKIEDLGFDLTLTGDAAVLCLGTQFNAGTTLTGVCDWMFLAKEGTLTGAGGVPDAFVRVYDGTGGGWANFLFDVPASVPYDAANSSGTQSGKIAIRVGGATKYIQCYSD